MSVFRTTEAQVASIIDTESDISLEPFIATANSLVTGLCTNSGYDDTRLELIERYLAAHFYTLREPRSVSEGAGPVNTSYQSSVGLGLNTSHYGQMAKLLDTAGNLAEAEQVSQGETHVRKVKVAHVGGRRSWP